MFACHRSRRFFLPFKSDDSRRPYFTTSPSFLDSSFARCSSELMDPLLDPEKQFYDGYNPELQHFASYYANRFLPGKNSPNIISDIGRNWRASLKLEKSTINGVSTWHQS
jgi:hypothetical protein